MKQIIHLKDQLLAKWIPCSLISDKQSVRYGLYFSYPIYILIVVTGILMKSPLILLITAVIAFLGIKLPLHPFDYVYNQIAKLIGINQIPGRGSELQVNSIVALVFNLVVLALIALNVTFNFTVLAIIYTTASIFFIGKFLLK